MLVSILYPKFTFERKLVGQLEKLSTLSNYQIYIVYILFQGVMVRLMLVLAPIMCILSGITISHLLNKFMKNVELQKQVDHKKHKKLEANLTLKSEISSFFVLMTTLLLISYTFHCTWVTSEAYSSPSIVLSARSHDGGRIIFDDFREAYYW